MEYFQHVQEYNCLIKKLCRHPLVSEIQDQSYFIYTPSQLAPKQIILEQISVIISFTQYIFWFIFLNDYYFLNTLQLSQLQKSFLLLQIFSFVFSPTIYFTVCQNQNLDEVHYLELITIPLNYLMSYRSFPCYVLT